MHGAQAIFWPFMIGILAVNYPPVQHASVMDSIWSTGSEAYGIRALSLQFRWLRGSLRVAADSLRLIGNSSTAHEPDGVLAQAKGDVAEDHRVFPALRSFGVTRGPRGCVESGVIGQETLIGEGEQVYAASMLSAPLGIVGEGR